MRPHDQVIPMKKLGIVGGVGWPSTVDYYRALCRLSDAYYAGKGVNGPTPIPEMSIESIDINKSFGLRGGALDDHASWAGYDQYFRDALLRLEASGAELAIIAGNTPHNRFAAITDGIRIPVLSIFEAVAQECVRLGARDLLILGTAPTMELPVFRQVLSSHAIDAQPPKSAAERKKVVDLIAELYASRGNGAAARIRGVIHNSLPATGRMRNVCLACTELPHAFRGLENESSIVVGGTRYLNSTMIHARAAFAALLAS